MLTAIKPVKKFNDDKFKLDKKVETDRKKAEDQEKFIAEKANVAVRVSLKRKLGQAKTFLHGSAVADGAKEIHTLRSDEEFKKFVEKFDFAEPVALVGSTTIKAILDDKADQGKTGFWMEKWFFASECFCPVLS